MKKRIFIFQTIILLIVFLLLTGSKTSKVQDRYSESPLILKIIETSDIHGAIFPYNFIENKPMKTSLAQLNTLIKKERAKKNQEVILIDNGDILQGQPTVYYYNFEDTKSKHIATEVLNFMKYDAITMGNHDIEAGHPVYDKMVKELKMPALAANAVKSNGSPYFKPYTIINKNGVKIAVLGMITPKIPSWLPQKFWSGMEFEDMVKSAKKWVKIIQKKEKPDLVIGLFHSGVDYMYGGSNADTVNNENASQLVAERVPGFDIIFVGHDHQSWNGTGLNDKEVKDPNGKTVYIYGSKASVKAIPFVTVSMLYNKEKNAWEKTITGELKNIDGVSADKEFENNFKSEFNAVKKYVDRSIGKMTAKITTRDSMFGPSAFVDLIHRIQLELTNDPSFGLNKAQISFAAPLSFDATVPSSDDLTLYVRDMFNLYVYENFLYTMNLTGKQIKDFLEYSYGGWFDTMSKESDHLIAFKRDEKGNFIKDNRSGGMQTKTRYYNYDSAAGVKYTVDISKPEGERINIISLDDGTPFDLDKTYSVAINSYRAQGGGGHLTKGAGIPQADLTEYKLVTSTTIKDLRYYLMKWIEKQESPIKPFVYNNWKVIPEDLAKSGKELDYPLLYSK